MRIDRLTSKLQLALSDSQSLAVGLDHPAIEPAHLMQALLEQQGGSIKPLLMQVGFDVNSLRKELSKELDQLPKIQNPTGDVNMSQDLARLLNQADRLAQQKGDQFISSELVLLAAMDDNSKLGKGFVCRCEYGEWAFAIERIYQPGSLDGCNQRRVVL